MAYLLWRLEVRRRSCCNRCTRDVIPAKGTTSEGAPRHVEVPACTMRTELLRDNRPSGQVKPLEQNQPLGGLTHPEQVGQPKRRTVPWTQGLSRPKPSMSAFVTARRYPGVSVYRRARARDLSGSMFLTWTASDRAELTQTVSHAVVFSASA